MTTRGDDGGHKKSSEEGRLRRSSVKTPPSPKKPWLSISGISTRHYLLLLGPTFLKKKFPSLLSLQHSQGQFICLFPLFDDL